MSLNMIRTQFAKSNLLRSNDPPKIRTLERHLEASNQSAVREKYHSESKKFPTNNTFFGIFEASKFQRREQ